MEFLDLPKRLAEFEKVSKSYVSKLAKYEKAKIAHEQRQALYLQPDGLKQYRKDKVLEILENTRTTDGFEKNINMGMSELMFRDRLIHFFGDRFPINSAAIPNRSPS